MKNKLLIISGSLHKVPPEENGTAVAALIYYIAENLPEYDIQVISYNKGNIEKSLPTQKYIYIQKNTLKYRIYYKIAKITPLKINKYLWGKDNPKFIAYYWSLKKIVKKINPDIILTTMHIDSFFSAYKAHPTAKHIFYFRSSNISDEKYEKLNSLCSKASKVITLTAESRMFLEQKFPLHSEKFITIPNAINRKIFNDNAAKGISKLARQRWHISSEDFVIGYAGRLSKSKGIDIIIEAFKIIYEKDQKVKLLIAGNHKMETIPEYDFQDQLIHLLNSVPSENIIFTGWLSREQMLLFYSALDVAILLSQQREGNSMFLLESQSCGIPVIASSIGGNNEIIKNGLTGYLVEKDDKSSIANIIFSLMNNKGKLLQLSDEAVKTIVEDYNYDRLIAQLRQVLNEVTT